MVRQIEVLAEFYHCIVLQYIVLHKVLQYNVLHSSTQTLLIPYRSAQVSASGSSTEHNAHLISRTEFFQVPATSSCKSETVQSNQTAEGFDFCSLVGSQG